jgi:hypothetical protein
MLSLLFKNGDCTELALFLAGFVSLIGLVARMAGVWS